MHACRTLYRHLLYLGLTIVLWPSLVKGWDRPLCLNETLQRLQENPSMALDVNTFAADSQGNLLASPPIVALKVPACERICGTSWTTYPDAAPRLMTWLIPVLVLIANLQYAAMGKGRFLAVLHLLGDPIDSMLSLLSKVETWRRCYQGREGPSRYGAVITAGIEELVETFQPDFNRAQVGLILQDMLFRPDIQPRQFNDLVVDTASELADCRVNQTLRTWSSIVFYLVQVIAAFVPKLGQASSPSGGRIGTAMLLSWLLPIALLSNAVGDFASRRTLLRILLRFMEQVERQGGQRLSEPSMNLLKGLREVDEKHFKSLAWSGAIYTYRPRKMHWRSAVGGCDTPCLALVSSIPVILAFVTAFLVLYNKPTYFNCRHLLVVSVFAAWLLSPLLTWTIVRSQVSQQHQWYFVLAKDAIIAFPIMALIIGSSCGLFNSCWCWSGVYTLGIRKAAVYLTNPPQFDRYNRVDYPAIVATCLGLQVGVFLLVRWTYFRQGLNLLNWSEKEKETAFLRNLQSTTTSCGLVGSSRKEYFHKGPYLERQSDITQPISQLE
jgi:hypothetical protein